MEDGFKFLQKKNIDLYLCGVLGRVRDRMTKSGLMQQIGLENIFMVNEDALNAFLNRDDKNAKVWTTLAIQSNVDGE